MKMQGLGRYFSFVNARLWAGRFDPILVVAVLTLWVGILPRIIVPDRQYTDRGTFVSVAERLLAGDTLYSGVYDNKEPLFYYFVAAQRAIGSWSELAAEAMLIGITAAAAYMIAIKLSTQWTAATISFIAVPIILTGTFYFPGYSELPGIALVLVAITASAYERSVPAGLCIGLLIFTKLIYVPIALIGVSCFLITRRQFWEAQAIAVGVLTSALAVVALLLLRAELLPFLETIKLNIAYSQGILIGSKKGLAALAEHIRRIGSWRFAGALAPILLANVLILIVLPKIRDRDRAQRGIAGVCISTLASSLLALSCTGLWPYHKQMLYIPSIFAIVAMASLIDMAAQRTRLLTLGLVSLTSYLLAGSPYPRIYVQSLHTSLAQLSWVSPEPQHLLKLGNSGTYARFGWGDDGHAIGLRHWKLACPRFEQFPFEPETVLTKVLECASTSPIVLISANFTPRKEFPLSKEFVDQVEHLLDKSYSCDADSGLRVCIRSAE